MMNEKNAARLTAVLFAVLALCALALVLGAEGADAEFTKEWTRGIGSVWSDEEASVAVDNSGNVYMAGLTWGGVDGNAHTSATSGWISSDMFFTKYSQDGVKQWTRQFGSDQTDTGKIVVDMGNIYVVGSTEDCLGGNLNNGQYDCYIVKYSQDGVKQWTRQFGTKYSERIYDAAVDSNGDVYLVGWIETYKTGAYVYDRDILIVKYSSSGAQQWMRTLGSADYEKGAGIALDSSGSFYICGETTGNLGGNQKSGNGDGFIAKYSSSGANQWVRLLGTSSYDGCNDIALDASGNVYVTGMSMGNLDGNLNSGGFGDAFIAKYSPSGAKQWAMLLGTIDSDKAMGIVVRGQNAYITGSTSGTMEGNVKTSSKGMSDVFVAGYSTSGAKLWVSTFGTSQGADGTEIGADLLGNALYVAGRIRGNLSGYINKGGTDLFLAKYSAVSPTTIFINLSVTTKPTLPSAPAINTAAFTSQNGTYRINWTSSALAERYVLQQNGVNVCNLSAPGGLSYSFSGMSDSMYIYRVRAWSQNGTSNWSAPITVTVYIGRLPGVPQITTPPQSTTETSYMVEWTAADYGGMYILEENGAEVVWLFDTLHYTLDNKTPNDYTYRVRSMNTNGSSNWSAAITVRVFTSAVLPSTPAITTAAFETLEGNYSVNWTAEPDATDYILEENGVEIYAGPDLTRGFSDRAVDNYTYRVKAANVNGTSNWSAAVVVSVMAANPPAEPTEAPQVTTAPFTSTEGNITVNWTAVQNATAYVVEVDGREVGYTPDAALTFENLTEGNYTFRIGIMGDNGSPEWSEPITISVDTGEPGQEEAPPAPPYVLFTSHQNGDESPTQSIFLEGMAGGGLPLSEIEASLDNITWVPMTERGEFGNGTTYWALQVNLSAGANLIRVRAIDEAQNTEVGAIEILSVQDGSGANQSQASTGASGALSFGVVEAAAIGGVCAAVGVVAVVLVMRKLKKKP